MNRYIVLYHAPKTVAARFAQATPEQAAQGLKLWLEWQNKLGSALVDMGKPLGNAMRITKDGAQQSDSTVVGMSILQAPGMDEALAMVQNHHHLQWDDDCHITLLEEVPIPELQAK